MKYLQLHLSTTDTMVQMIVDVLDVLASCDCRNGVEQVSLTSHHVER